MTRLLLAQGPMLPNPGTGGGTGGTQGTQLGGQPITGPGAIGAAVNENLGSSTGIVDVFSQQLSNLIGFITVIASIFFVVYFLIAAFEWIQSGGDTAKVAKAQQRMINAAIGMLVLVISFGILGVISGVFGVDLLNPGAMFLQLIPGGGVTK